MHSHEEEPRCTKYLPKMVLADSVPSHSKETLSKLDKHTKNLSIQTDLISNNNTTKTTKSFDLKRYLNRNSPKYYNLNEKLQTFENSAKNKNFQPFIPAKPLKRNLTPNNVKTEITQKNTQNSTIDQTPKPIENEKNKEEFDYENNFIIAKVNNFFKEKKNNITKPKSEENRLKTPQKIKGWAFDDNKPTEQRKKSERALVKSAERPLKEIKSLKTENDDLDADYNKKPLFLITENRENEDLHNRYQKEIKNLLNKSPIEKNKKNLTKNSLSLSLDKPKLVKTKVEIKEKPKKNIKVTNDKVETKESKAENPQIPTKCEQYEEEEEIKTREKKKTLEKFITQINRGEIFAKPIENSKKTKKNNVRQLEIIEKKANKPKIIRNNIKENKKSTYYFSDLVQAYRVNSIDCDYFTQLYKEHLSQSFQALSYCKNIKPEPKQIEEKKVFLKRRETHKNKKTLIFDLDETLIHCNEMMDVPSEVILPITFPNGELIEAGINVRPYVHEVLNILKESYEIIVFTASHNCYANRVLDYLDPKKDLIHHRLFREHCVVTEEGIHVKDLRVLANRKLEDVVIVDNACYSFGYQIDNGIPIIPYYDNPKDEELKHLLEYLKGLVNRDIREINRKTFKLNSFQKYQTIEELAEGLFE